MKLAELSGWSLDFPPQPERCSTCRWYLDDDLAGGGYGLNRRTKTKDAKAMHDKLFQEHCRYRHGMAPLAGGID